MNRILETERLIIRKFAADDAQRLYENHLDAEVQKWFPNESYQDVGEAREAIQFFADCVNRKELPYVLAVESKETGKLIGDTGLNEVEGKSEEVEIGFIICRECRGKGYASELVKTVSEFAFSVFGVNALYGRVMHGNAASQRVLEKCGYTFVREEAGAEDDPWGKGMLVYRKEKDALSATNDPKEVFP